MKKKGISLIVLVITIIIMIIIAGAIILTLTETNIIDRAETAVNKYNETELKQRISLVFTEAQMAKYTDLEYSIEDNIQSIFEGIYGKDNITVAKSGKNYKVNVKDSKTTFRIKPDGSIQEYEEMDPTNVYARLDDEGVLYLRATEKEGYNIYTDYTSIQSDWNTAGDATHTLVVKVVIEEEIAPTTTSSMFSDMANLIRIENIHNLHTENVTSMSYMFAKCNKLENVDLTNFDTAKVTNMNYMFWNCKSFTSLDVSSFDTSNIRKFEDAFNGCDNLITLDLTNFDTSKAESMVRMFAYCRKLQSINVSSFSTTNVKGVGLNSMFAYCNSLENLDITNFDTSNATSLGYLFEGCTNLTNLDITNFNTQKITNIKYMFHGCANLRTIKLSGEFVINDGVDLTGVFKDVNSDIKITATEDTRDKLISASSLTEANFEIIESVE